MRILTVAMMLSLAAVASADVIFDQIGPNANAVNGKNVFASQEFEAAYSAYDIAVVDNFTVTGGPYFLTSAEAVVGFWNHTPLATWNNCTAFRVEIYSSVAAATANLVGDVAHFDVAAGVTAVAPWGTGVNNQAKVNIPLSGGPALAPGTYYMAVMPKLVFGTWGQSGISGSSLGDLNAGQSNPGTGFPFQWQPISPAENAAYRLNGVIPEPTSLALLALGSLVLIRRR